jgi:hypothetical protein
MANAMNPWGYDVESEHVERRRMMYARGRARHLLTWIFQHFALIDKEGKEIDPLLNFFYPYFAHQAKALIKYRKIALEHDMHPRYDDKQEEDDTDQETQQVTDKAKGKRKTKQKSTGKPKKPVTTKKRQELEKEKRKAEKKQREADEKYKMTKKLIEEALRSSLDLWNTYINYKSEPSTLAYSGPRFDVRRVTGKALFQGMSLDFSLFSTYDLTSFIQRVNQARPISLVS